MEVTHMVLWFVLLCAVACGVAGMGLGIHNYNNKANKLGSVPPPVREQEAVSKHVPTPDTLSLPNDYELTFTKPHTANPFFLLESRSTLDGYVRPTSIRELTSTKAVVQLQPDWEAGGKQTKVLSASGVTDTFTISTSRADHRHHRNQIKAAPVTLSISSTATVNASDKVNGLCCMYYTDYTAGGDLTLSTTRNSSLMYTFYSPLTHSWILPQMITQYNRTVSSATKYGYPFDFAVCSLAEHAALAWVDPNASATQIKFRRLHSALSSAEADCAFNNIDTTDSLVNAGTGFVAGTLAMCEFDGKVVIGYLVVNSDPVYKVKIVVGTPTVSSSDPNVSTFTFGTPVNVITSASGGLSALAANSRSLNLTPFTHPDGTKRLAVSFTVAGTSNNTGVAYLSASADLVTPTFTKIDVAPATTVDATNYSDFALLHVSPSQLVAVWQNATSGKLEYCYSLNTAGVISFPSANVKTLKYKCNGTFAASVQTTGEWGVLFQVASDETETRYQNLPMYAYVTGETTVAYSSLYMNDGLLNTVGSCVGLTTYENAPAIFLSSGVGSAASNLLNFQGNADNRAMTPGLNLNYFAY